MLVTENSRMTETKAKYEKILFKYLSPVLDELVVETMWAIEIDRAKGIYQLDSIPFYGPLIATDDEFYAEFDESEQMLIYRKTTKYSGNSIVLVSVCAKDFDKEIIRDRFKVLNCASEGLNDYYFSMEILKDVNYATIRKMLTTYENEKFIEYAEPCLSEKHQKDII